MESPRPNRWIVAGIICAGVVMVLMSTYRYGLGISNDGVIMLSAGENFAEGNGLLRFDEKYLIHWLPLLPVLVGSLYKLTGIDTLAIGLWINLIAYSAIVFLSGTLFYRSLSRDRLWFYTGCLLTVTSVSFLSMGTNLSTDILYILEFLGFLTTAQEHFEKPRLSTSVRMGIITALATLTRYSGAVLLAAGMLFIAIASWRERREMFRYAGVFGALAGIPILLWVLLRNLPLTGTPAGGYDWKNVLILENVKFSYARMSQWLLPHQVTSRLPWLVLLLLLGLVLVLAVRRAYPELKSRLSTHALRPIWILALLYFPFVQMTSVTHDHIDIYDDRYQLPLFGLIGILTLLALGLIWPGKPDQNLIRRRSFQLLLLLWLAYPIYSVFSYTRSSYSHGVIYYNQYNRSEFLDTEFAQALREYPFPAEARIYSNMSEGAYLLTRRPIHDSFYDPTAGFAGFASDEYLSANYDDWDWGQRAHLIWFKPNEKNYYFTPSQLGRFFQMVVDLSLEGGQLFRIANR